MIKYVKIAGCYQLVSDAVVETGLELDKDIVTERITLSSTGKLTVLSGFCWDGVSGPCIDRKTNMRGGLFHDALYQLMRMGKLNHSYWKEADRVFGKIIREDGCWPITVKIDLMGLSLARGSAAKPKNRRKVRTL